ncbi:MAG: heavy metal translocating P-type ATPase [Thermoplasmata archaeon]
MARERKDVRIEGLHCADCVKKIERSISRLPGINAISINFATGRMEIVYDTEKITLEQIRRAVKRMGYGVLREEIETETVFSLSNSEFVLTILSGCFLGMGLTVALAGFDSIALRSDFGHVTFSEMLFAAAMVLGGYFPARRAATAIANRGFVMDGLMIVGALGAVLIDAFPEGAAVLFLFSLAELLEDYSVERTRDSLTELMGFRPKTANVKKNGVLVETKVEDIEIGDIVLVRPGEQIGVDGNVVAGYSMVDQSPITGESVPVPKGEGDEVFAGTINREGRIEVVVTKGSSDTTLSKIVQMVESAADRRSQTARFIDRFARFYTPAVLLMSVSVATIPTFVLDQPFDVWFYKALLLLLISCPCALAISTPISMASSITGAARNGTLIKGGACIERLSQVDVLAFDKTGTITEGRIVVTDVIPLDGHSKEEVLRIAASLECLSGHPLGAAITALAEKEGIPLECVEDFQSIPGKGIKGSIGGSPHVVGSESVLEYPIEPAVKEKKLALENKGNTTILVGKEDETIGIIAMADKVRDSARRMISTLRENDGYDFLMLTGDNDAVARRVAGQIGAVDYRSELLPVDKARLIGGISRSGKKVVMVGDGVNDAPALIAADLGIAMGAAGSDTALEVADVALMSDDLSKIPYLLRLGRKTMRVVKTNIVVAIGVKLLFAVLVFPGLVTLWMAVAIGDMGVSLAVILNALRLARVG